MNTNESATREADLRERVAELERLLAIQNRRVERLEQRLLAEHRASVHADTRNTVIVAHAPASTPHATQPNTPRADALPTVASSVSVAQSSDLEQRIGGRWLNRVGIVIVVFGVAFLIKYAFENEWLTPLMRVLLGVAGGISALACAGALRRRGYADYAYGLAGGGIVILYLAIYAAFAFYNLIGQPLAFVSMLIVTALAVVLSARFDALVIAVLGIVGGFLTPVLLSTGVSNEVALFGYMTLLNSGVLVLASVKGWRVLNHLAFIATWLTLGAWAISYYGESKFSVTFLFVTLFYFVFAFVPVLQNILRLRAPRWLDISLLVANANIYFAAGYALLERAPATRALFALLLCIVNLLLFVYARSRASQARLIAYTFAALAGLFVALAVAIQLEGRWVTLAWTVMGAAGFAFGVRKQAGELRLGALALLGATVLKIFLLDLAALDPVSRIASFLVLGAALLTVSFLYQKRYQTE